MVKPVIRFPCAIWRDGGSAQGEATRGGATRGERAIPEETAIAFTFNTASYAVMMATPQDLEDFAVGFSLTEGVIASAEAIESVEIVEDAVGIELRIWLKARDAAEFLGRRRKMAGPTGCGLCGIESLAEAMRPPPEVGEGVAFTPDEIMMAVNSLFPQQALNQETRAVHAAGFWTPARGMHAGKRALASADQIRDYRQAEMCESSRVLIGVDNQIGDLPAKPLDRISEQRPVAQRNQAFVAAAHARRGAAGKQHADGFRQARSRCHRAANSCFV